MLRPVRSAGRYAHWGSGGPAERMRGIQINAGTSRVRWGTGLLAAVVVAAVTAALAAAAGSISSGGGNVVAARADVRILETRLAAAMRRIDTHRINLGPIHGAEARALERFPPVFGRAYAQTFLPLECVVSQPARARACARTLVGLLRASTASSSVRSAARSLRAAVGRRPKARLGRAESVLIHRFPNVFGLPYQTTFTSLACILAGLSQADALIRRRPGSGKAPLASLRRADGCAKLLEAELAPIKTGAPSTAPPSPTTASTAAPAGPAQASTPIYRDTRYSFAERAADLVSRMTLAEKVAQLRTDSAPAIARLGVQQYTYWSEGQHGVNALGANTNHGGASGGPHATSFPTNFAAAMTWDPGLMYQETTAISDEVRGFLDKSLWNAGQNNLGPSAADYGSLTFWAPTVNLDRDPRWGRTDEAFGEDPYLVSRMAGAFVDGYQGQTITGQPMTPYLKVAATAKHFALNDVENSREAISSVVDDTDLHDYYTAQFRSLIEDAHVSGLMTSLNAINGTPAMADTYTDNLVAQRTYGFNGYTTSDCALSNIYRSSPNGHNWAPPGWSTDGQDEAATWTNSGTGATVSGAAGAEAYALRAGTDLNCPGRQATLANIEQAIGAGILSEGVIDNALIHLFTVRMQTGEFDPAAQVPYTSITKSTIQSQAHQALARQVADNSLVLLKNDNVSGTTTPVLPADPSKLNNVVILGDLANKVTLGGYSGSPSLQVSAVQGIKNAVLAANPSATITYDAAGTATTSSTPVSLSGPTQQAIQKADLVIVVVGTDAAVAGEGHDRSTIAMPGNYDSLISQVATVGNPRMALVIQSDGPVKIGDVQSDFPAIVFSGYNGESQGDALADALFGKQNPSGHLDFTWYADDSQLPAMSNYGLAPGSTGGLGRTYMYFTGTPTYPFGYGLSYSKFSFSNLQASTPTVSADGTETLTFDVTNTGAKPGATVAQVYAATPAGLGSSFPVKRLEAFAKTEVLPPGQHQTIRLNFPISRLEFWDQSSARWGVPDGTYQFQLGPDASQVAQSAPVTVTGALTPHVQYVTVQPPAAVYKPGDRVDLTAKNPWLADDTSPPSAVSADHIVEAVDTDGSFVDLAKAQVSYTSSNDSVAKVTSGGVLTAEAPGVATISVSVDGVTGSAVIAVKRPLSLAVPAVTEPGSTFTATETLLNTSASAISNASLALSAPAGWGISATGPTSFASVPAGGSVQASWSVTAPAGVAPSSYELDASAHASDGTETDPAVAAVPYSSLGAAFDNVGISDNGNPAAGDLDGGGRSYSAQDLAGASLSPGAPVIHDGLSFTWPDAPAGMPDNVSATGQAIPISRSGSRLGFLGTGDFGTATGTGTVVYSDGSTQSYGLALADWWANKAAPGGDILTTTAHVNTAGGEQTRNASVYFTSVPLDPGKTVSYVILPPDVSQGTAGGNTEMHIFSIAIG
jgi:beta-glucosidase